jgi:hypothetical protein
MSDLGSSILKQIRNSKSDMPLISVTGILNGKNIKGKVNTPVISEVTVTVRKRSNTENKRLLYSAFGAYFKLFKLICDMTYKYVILK